MFTVMDYTAQAGFNSLLIASFSYLTEMKGNWWLYGM